MWLHLEDFWAWTVTGETEGHNRTKQRLRIDGLFICRQRFAANPEIPEEYKTHIGPQQIWTQSPCLICLYDFTNCLVRRKWKLISELGCEGLVVTIYDRWESKHDLFLRKLAQMAGCWSRKKSGILNPGSLAYVGYILILFPLSAEYGQGGSH